MYKYAVSLPRFIMAGWAFYVENEYFGWNRLPGSDAELICDLIIMVMFLLTVTREKV